MALGIDFNIKNLYGVMANWGIWILILIIVSGVIIFNLNSVEIVQENEEPEQEIGIMDSFSETAGLHWTHMPLTYEIYDCTDYQANRAIRGFNKITNETDGIVSFKKFDNSSLENSEPDIEVHCKENYKYSDDPNYLVSGDSAYSVYSANPNLIAKAYINFYAISATTYSGGCTVYPDIEVHEILHGFGYGHNSSTKSIMYPSHVMCAFKIDDNIIEDMKEKYG